MTKTSFRALALAALALVLSAGAAEGPLSRVQLILVDGSSLRADAQTATLRASSELFGDFPVNFADVTSLSLISGSVARISFRNLDIITARLLDDALPVRSSLGNLTVPWTKVKKATFSTTVNSTPDDHLIFSCTFDDAESILNPAVGPKGQLGNGTFEPGVVGNAVHIPRYGNGALFSLPAGFLKKTGCIEFWAKIGGTRDYHGVRDPRFFCIMNPIGHYVQMEFSSNNGSGDGGLNCLHMGLAAVSTRICGEHFYSEILGKGIHDWHHYAMSWSEHKLTIYLDGKVLKMGHYWGDGINPESLATGLLEFGVPFVHGETVRHPNTDYYMDELKIWDCEKSEFDLVNP